MVVTFLPNVTEVNEEHPQKVDPSIVLMSFPIFMDISPAHDPNALYPKEETSFPIVALSRAEHS